MAGVSSTFAPLSLECALEAQRRLQEHRQAAHAGSSGRDTCYHQLQATRASLQGKCPVHGSALASAVWTQPPRALEYHQGCHSHAETAAFLPCSFLLVVVQQKHQPQRFGGAQVPPTTTPTQQQQKGAAAYFPKRKVITR